METKIKESKEERAARIQANKARLEAEKQEAAERRSNSEPKVCSRDYMLFPVEMRDEEMPSNSDYCKRIVGQINGGDFLLNQCSPVYELVPNIEIFPKIEEVLDNNGIKYVAKYTHVKHVRFYADYTITDNRYAYNMNGTGDTIQPMLRVQHSYNGLTKYRITFGYFRLVCSNGLVIPVKEMEEFNLVIVGKHTESIKLSFKKLDIMLHNFTQNAKQITTQITAKYEQLGGVWVANPQDRIAEVLKACDIAAVDNNKFNTIDNILERIEKEANSNALGYNGKVNDWLIYNGINQYLNDNDRNIAVPEKRMETDSKVLEYLLEYEPA